MNTLQRVGIGAAALLLAFGVLALQSARAQTSNEDGRIAQQGNPQAECDAIAEELGTGPLDPFAKYENQNGPGGSFVDDLPGDGDDISFDPDPPTVPSGSWESTTPIQAFLIKQSTFIDYWANPGLSLEYISPEDDYSHFTFCVGETFECDSPMLGEDEIDKTDRTLSNTIQDDEGISEFTFSTLDNFTVASISPSGYDRSGNTWTWVGAGTPPTSVDFTLQAGPGNTSTYFLEVTDACTDPNTVTFDPSYEIGSAAVTKTQLSGNAPNPFSEQTTVEFTLAEQRRVSVAVYDMMGRKVATLVDGVRSAGTHAIGWGGQADSGKNLASGVYLLRMKAGNQSSTQRVTIVR